jgi:hypothetical protein
MHVLAPRHRVTCTRTAEFESARPQNCIRNSGIRSFLQILNVQEVGLACRVPRSFARTLSSYYFPLVAKRWPPSLLISVVAKTTSSSPLVHKERGP